MSIVLLSGLLNIVPGTGIVAEIDYPCKSVQHVTDCDVERLTKDPIALNTMIWRVGSPFLERFINKNNNAHLPRICNYLGVSARDI